MKKNLAKEQLEIENVESADKQAEEKEKERQVEEAFLFEERKAIQKEQNEKMVTKRLTDKMLASESNELNNAACDLLSNFGGSTAHKINFFII